MVITFCGHVDFCYSKEYEQKVLHFFEEKIGQNRAEFYLGGYGGFDKFAYNCCKKYKETHPNVILVFITPYLIVAKKDEAEYLKEMYDDIIYPPIEDKPKRFAIVYRNRTMVDKADYVIAYVKRSWGGAYQTYRYALNKGKQVINLTKLIL